MSTSTPLKTTVAVSAFGAPLRDLGSLAWVMDELNLALTAVETEVRQFVQAHALARSTDLSQVDDSGLRLVRQQLHQAVGALEMVNLGAAAKTLHALEAVLQRWIQRPLEATIEVEAQVHQGMRAVKEYLDRIMRERPLPDVALFPTYQAWQVLAGAGQVQPADLWEQSLKLDVDLPPGKVYQPGAAVRAHLDKLVLQVVKSLDPQAAVPLAQICGGLSRGASHELARQFWLVSAAFFEAVAQSLLPQALVVKRAAARVLVGYAQCVQGKESALEPLAHDLAFYVAMARPGTDAVRLACPHLTALQSAYGWGDAPAWDFQQTALGLHDPADLRTLQQRVDQTQQTWTRWTEGDNSAQAAVAAAVSAMAQAMPPVHPALAGLAQLWTQVGVSLEVSADALPEPLALEGANSLLFLGAVLEDFEPLEPVWPERFEALQHRLSVALQGQSPPVPEPWMSGIYQRLNQRQTLVQVVAQLEGERAEVEQVLDAFFRQPDVTLLAPLVARIDAMLGVVVMLGVPAAQLTLARMRDTLSEWVAQAEAPAQVALQTAAQVLGPNLSALGWLLDTLARQPEVARAQFVFDSGAGLLRDTRAVADVNEAAIPVVSGEHLERPEVLEPPEAVVDVQDEEAEMLAIFTEEAQDVLDKLQQAWQALVNDPASLSDLTTVRRGFHTLKGSARMVGLKDFGEAAWSMEQLLNMCLAEQQPASPALLELVKHARDYLVSWIEGLVAGQSEAQAGRSEPIRRCADALRVDGCVLPWFQEETAPAPMASAEVVPEPEPMAPVYNESVKVVGPLNIDLELYNVFLNESDEWSRRLSTALGEWALQPHAPLPPEASPLAHSLTGASSTVGYTGLSTLARALEHALDRVLALLPGQRIPDNEVGVLVQSAEELRHLLHQFAAGFLIEPAPETLEVLARVAMGEVQTLSAAPTTLESREALSSIDRLEADVFEIFEEEAQELLPRMGAALRQWSARPDNQGARAELLRNLHTFKGSARLAGALRLGDMAHQLESDVLALPEVPPPDVVSRLLADMDALVARFEALSEGFAKANQGEPLLVEGANRSAPEDVHMPVMADLTQLQPQVQLNPGLAVSTPMVRVRADLLDQLMAQTGDVMLTRTRLSLDVRVLRQSFEEMGANVDRLRQQLRDLELQTETQMQSRLSQNREYEAKFDPLEFDRYTRVQELTRSLAESVNDVATVQFQLKRVVESAEGNLAAQARQTRDLQRDLLRTRMVAFDSVGERLHRLVRQTAQSQDKQVELHIQSGELELDRGVLDRLIPALEHLLRNAVVHGIEAPGQRAAQGKSEVGRIGLTLEQNGNDLSLSLSDDGMGLNVARLRERAESLGLHTAGQPFDEADAARTIFEAGVSTAESVTEVAGRGIGMDAVRSDVVGLGGRIEYFRPSVGGTGFRMVVPLSTAVTQVVMLRVGHFTFAVPAPWVEVVRRPPMTELKAAYQSGIWHEGDKAMPFYWGGSLLAQSIESTDEQSHEAHSWPVLVFYSAGQRVAWHVDEVLGHQEVVVKPLGPQLSSMPGLAGATALASGMVALIYNPVALTTLFGEAARQWVRTARMQGHTATTLSAAADWGQGTGQAPLVLVVDDSITVRRVTQRLLKREGYRVALAADGVQALERLAEEAPAVVLCDIEMPRMDGFEFVQHLRNDPQWETLPVIMITSRLADKHREHAQALGVDHYLGKPYAEEDLLSLVQGYARQVAQPVSI